MRPRRDRDLARHEARGSIQNCRPSTVFDVWTTYVAHICFNGGPCRQIWSFLRRINVRWRCYCTQSEIGRGWHDPTRSSQRDDKGPTDRKARRWARAPAQCSTPKLDLSDASREPRLGRCFRSRLGVSGQNHRVLVPEHKNSIFDLGPRDRICVAISAREI